MTPHAAAQTLGATATTGAPLVWANAPSVEEIVGCVGRCRIAAAACGAFAVPTRNVDATTLVRTVDLATHAGCVEGGPGGGYAAGADAAYKTAVAGGAYTVADWRGAIANDARNFSAFNASFNATTRAASLVGAARCDADGDGVEDALASLPPSPSRASACPWLSPEGAYDVWVVAEDDGNDVLANASAGGNGTTTAANRGTHAFRALPPNPENWTGPSLVVADVAPPTFTASYPALIDLNGSALRFDASLSEPGAVVFALRLNASSDPVATRAGIEARANFSAISREPYAALVPGANAGVLNVTDANVNVSHVITDLPEPDLSSTRRGATLAVDYFAIDLEPTRLSSLTRSTRAVPNAGPVRVATRKMSDVEPPVWTASGCAEGGGGSRRRGDGERVARRRRRRRRRARSPRRPRRDGRERDRLLRRRAERERELLARAAGDDPDEGDEREHRVGGVSGGGQRQLSEFHRRDAVAVAVDLARVPARAEREVRRVVRRGGQLHGRRARRERAGRRRARAVRRPGLSPADVYDARAARVVRSKHDVFHPPLGFNI